MYPQQKCHQHMPKATAWAKPSRELWFWLGPSLHISKPWKQLCDTMVAMVLCTKGPYLQVTTVIFKYKVK